MPVVCKEVKDLSTNTVQLLSKLRWNCKKRQQKLEQQPFSSKLKLCLLKNWGGQLLLWRQIFSISTFSSFSATQLVISECLHANAKNCRKLWQPVINHSNHWEVCSAAASVQLISPSTHLQKPLPLSGCKHIFSLQLAVLLCPLWRTNLEQCVPDVTWETSCNWIVTELSYAALTCKVKRIFGVHPTRLIDSMFVVFFVTALRFKICLIQTILTGALEVWEHHLSVNELDQSAPFLN